MDERHTVDQLKSEGFDTVFIYEADPGEVDEEHEHDYDTRLIVLAGDIQIITELGGVIANVKYMPGQTIEIPRNKLHAARVGAAGCRYIVAEKHSTP